MIGYHTQADRAVRLILTVPSSGLRVWLANPADAHEAIQSLLEDGYTLDEMEFEMEFETMQERCCINCKIDEDEGYKG